MDIILYTIGSGGNMVTAVIDDTDYQFVDDKHYYQPRSRMKLSSQMFINPMTDEDRDEYIKQYQYLSLSSHCYQYHIKRKHNFIFVGPLDEKTLKWSIDRFNDIYKGRTTSIDNIRNTVDECVRHTDKIVSVSDILDGRLIDVLKQYVSTPLNEKIYFDWLETTLRRYPISK